MKKIVFIFLFLLSTWCNINAQTSLGKIIQITGDVDLTDIVSNTGFIPRIGTDIDKFHKIRTGKNSFVEILLNDGTKVFVREVSVLFITNLKTGENDPPTRIEVLTGKVRINVNRRGNDRSLILQTPTAFAGIPNIETDLGVITCSSETKFVIFQGRADIANSSQNIIKSYTLDKKEETTISRYQPPTEPVIVPPDILNSWLDYYDIEGTKRIIVRAREKEGIIDFILRKRHL